MWASGWIKGRNEMIGLARALGIKAHYDRYSLFESRREAAQHAIEQVDRNLEEFGRPVVYDYESAELWSKYGVAAQYYQLVKQALRLS